MTMNFTFTQSRVLPLAAVARGRTLVLVALVILWHLTVNWGLSLGLGDAEALYYMYSRHLAGGYLDHPPLIGWFIAGATALAGHHPAAVRLVSLVTHVAVLWGMFVWARDSFGDERAGWRAVLLLSLVPMMTIGGLAAAPDGPASALWVWTAVWLGRAMTRARQGKPPRWLDALAIGGLLGLTFLAKYTGFLLVVGAAIAFSGREIRWWWRRPPMVLAALTCLAAVSPVLWWNMHQGWASLLHRMVWSQGSLGPSWRTVASTVGGQLLYLGPVMAVLLAWALGQLWRWRGQSGAPGLLWALSWPPLLFTWSLCLVSEAAEPHWPVQGYLAAVVAVAGWSLGVEARWRPWARAASMWFGAVFIALHLLVFTTVWPFLVGAERYEPRYDLATELWGWPKMMDALLPLRRRGEPLACNHYTNCSQLALVLAQRAGPQGGRVLCLSPERDDYDYWGAGSVEGVASVLYVEDSRFGRPAAEVFPGLPAHRMAEVGQFDLRRGAWTVRSFRFVRVVGPF
jgi:hypothetical protein